MPLAISNLPWLGCYWVQQVGEGFACAVVTLSPWFITPHGAALLLVLPQSMDCYLEPSDLSLVGSVPARSCVRFPMLVCPVLSPWKILLNMGLSELALTPL